MMVRRLSPGLGLAAMAASAVLMLLWSAPLLWAFSTALRQEHETVLAGLHWLPPTWTTEAFSKVLSNGHLLRWLFNSTFIALLVTVLTIGISVSAAYAFSQLRFHGRQILFVMTMLAFMLPFEALVVPLFRLMNQLRLVDTYGGVILPQLISPITIYVFKQFFDAVPPEFRDAAAIDGASHWQMLRHIYLPLSANIVWAMSIVAFIGAWNNFLWPFIVIASPEMMTIPLGLTQTQDAFGVRYAQAMAAALLGGMPVALVYVVFQRRMTAGLLAATGLKG